MTLGERIVLERKRKGWTQEELAIKTHKNKATVSSWENGHTTPTHETFSLLCKLLEIEF